MREKKVHVNDSVSLNSLILVGKVTGDEVVFLCVPIFMLDRTLRDALDIFGYYRTPTKYPALFIG